MSSELQIIRSRCLAPVSSHPIFDGGMVIESGVIKDIGPWELIKQSYTGNSLDLGEMVVLPGLINAHCHLEYTSMANQIDRPKTFTQWIQEMIRLKHSWTKDDFQHSWRTGFEQSVIAGTTTIADTISQPINLCAEQIRKGARLQPLFEWIQLEGRPWDMDKQQEIEALVSETEKVTDLSAGLSPHALYTTTPKLWEFILKHPVWSNKPISVHMAESQEEMDLFLHQTGPMHDWFASMGHLPRWGKGSPAQLIQRKQLLRKGMIIVHGNCMEQDDLEILAKNQAGIVHCPRSHQFFDHPPFQLEKCRALGIPVAIGTDSLASIRTDQHPESLSLFHEIRLLLDTFPSISPMEAIEMATLTAAKVLGLNQSIGSLEPGKCADWICLPWQGSEKTLFEEIIQWTPPPERVVIRGEQATKKQI